MWITCNCLYVTVFECSPPASAMRYRYRHGVDCSLIPCCWWDACRQKLRAIRDEGDCSNALSVICLHNHLYERGAPEVTEQRLTHTTLTSATNHGCSSIDCGQESQRSNSTLHLVVREEISCRLSSPGSVESPRPQLCAPAHFCPGEVALACLRACRSLWD